MVGSLSPTCPYAHNHCGNPKWKCESKERRKRWDRDSNSKKLAKADVSITEQHDRPSKNDGTERNADDMGEKPNCVCGVM
ncbi:MAG: hypothetical protein CMJ78_03015 [Planctomycetaceae bacterium]|nr:hypothetical protein [Planctomycetaceae bacterium]